jgi:hypothetical protein
MMDWGIVLAALIGLVGTVLTTLMMAFRKENHDDHATVMEAIRTIGGNVDKIDSKLDSHIDWHLKGTNSGQVSKRNTTRKPTKKA